tara:strand:+ start:268 stop:444 length:177 start_codon:yes stop_codon:yes gene_type:complete
MSLDIKAYRDVLAPIMAATMTKTWHARAGALKRGAAYAVAQNANEAIMHVTGHMIWYS